MKERGGGALHNRGERGNGEEIKETSFSKKGLQDDVCQMSRAEGKSSSSGQRPSIVGKWGRGER